MLAPDEIPDAEFLRKAADEILVRRVAPSAARLMRKGMLLGAALFVLLATLGRAQITGTVSAVTDGDTITVSPVPAVSIRVRLYGIDAPDSGQPFAERAKEELSSLVLGKSVSVMVEERDRYGRTLGVVSLGTMVVNVEMIRRGFAWWYRSQAPELGSYGRAETQAHNAKRGLWAEDAPIPPWVHRMRERKIRSERKTVGVDLVSYNGRYATAQGPARRSRRAPASACRSHDTTILPQNSTHAPRSNFRVPSVVFYVPALPLAADIGDGFTYTITPVLDERSGTFTVRLVKFESADDCLRMIMSWTISREYATHTDALAQMRTGFDLLIPEDAPGHLLSQVMAKGLCLPRIPASN